MSEHTVPQETVALLRSATAKLGPERSEQALRAFDDPSPEWWTGCALACAYGPRGALRVDAALPGEWVLHFDEYAAVAACIGLSRAETDAVASAFDSLPSIGGQTARALLRSLLEAEAAKIRTAPVSAPETVSAR